MAKRIGIALSEKDFRRLVAGGAVEQNGVSILLNDIGWAAMERAIASAQVACWKVEREASKKWSEG